MLIFIEYMLNQLALTGSRSLRSAIFQTTKRFKPILITRHAMTILVLSLMFYTAKYSLSVL